MKSIFFLLFGAVLFTSCAILEFPQSQPQDAALLHEFPDHLIGSYSDGGKDTLVINKTSFKVGSKHSYINMDKNLQEGSVELKQVNNYYVMNLFNDMYDNLYWNVIPFVTQEDQITLYLFALEELVDTWEMNEEEVIDEINKIVKVKAVEIKGGESTVYRLTFVEDPTPKEFEVLLEQGFFVELITLKKIK